MNQDDNQNVTPPPASPEEESTPPVQKLTIPFEDRQKDFITGFFETLKLVILQPTYFFRNYKMDGEISKSMLFAVLAGWTAAVVEMLWSLVFKSSALTMLKKRLEDMDGFDSEQWGDLLSGLGTHSALGMIIIPIFIVIGLFISAGVYHVVLLIVKGANRNFETTFNVVAYGTSARLLEIVPFCGGILAYVYTIVLSIIGLSEAHETESWKATVSVLSPIILCCLCLVMMIAALGGVAGIAELANQ